MTEDQKYEIAVLAEDYENKRMRHEILGMLNTVGLSAEESTKRTIEYHIADAEKIEAGCKLMHAKARLGMPT